ncbi:MAG: SRPBCC family protein [Proteobacteria bacterium]|nr:SRPBCC family protein [Pseudomonadota bacterium]
MSTQSNENVVRQTISVEAPIERAFEVFTRDFGRFKPAEHNLLRVPIAETVFETRVGGYLFDRGVDGSECRWARVLAYDPPNRVVLTWNIGPDWQIEIDPRKVSEWEVRFTAEGPGRTRVELEHRFINRHGNDWEAVRGAVSSTRGWPLYLARYREIFQRAS